MVVVKLQSVVAVYLQQQQQKLNREHYMGIQRLEAKQLTASYYSRLATQVPEHG